MTTSATAVITSQTSAHSAPSPPVWFGELTVLAILTRLGERLYAEHFERALAAGA